jgi:hypothetical protein
MNRRIQVYDVEGKFKRIVADTPDTSACAFIPDGEFTLIPEAPYRARLTILDPDDHIVTTIGENDAVCGHPGFPNDRSLVAQGKFVTPHSAAVDANRNIYVVEWITGGRITKLARVK